ncbi:MAG: hypothetical protein FK734_07020 [Asgard group archaeon]|nr:hypothetical protein [Asgard group archaeon]
MTGTDNDKKMDRAILNNQLIIFQQNAGFRLQKNTRMELFKRIFSSLPLVAIIIISIIIRIFAASESQGFVHPDEVFQSIEMVHFRIFGRFGLGQTIPWEYNLSHLYGGARSWFFVFILVAVYRFVMLFGVTDPLALIFSVRLFLSLSSMITVLVSYYFGKEIYNKPVGLLTAFLCGTWWFFPFWASRTMTDSISSDLLFLAIFLVYKAIKRNNKLGRRTLYATLAGVSIGLAFMIRFPSAVMGIPLFVFLFIIGLNEMLDYILGVNLWKFTKLLFQRKLKQIILERKKTRDRIKLRKILSPFSVSLGLVGGSLLMVIIQGLIDLFTWGSFLHSPINFFIYNIIEDYSSLHGTSPWYSYFTGFWTSFASYFLPVFVLFYVYGMVQVKKVKTHVMLNILIFYWLIIFSFIGHKEFRFVMVVLPLALLMVSNGIYKLVDAIKKPKIRYTVLSFIIIFFSASSLGMATIEKWWYWKFNSGITNAMAWIGKQEDSKNLIVFEFVWYTGGYAYLDKNITCLFVRIDPFNPIGSIDSLYYQLLYSTNGTYAIVFEKDLFVVNWYLASFGMEVVAKFYGIPYVYVFEHK